MKKPKPSSPTALITGAGTGVGRAIAVQLSALGWRVALVSRTKENLKETARLCRKAGGRPIEVPCDVAKKPAVDRALSGAIARLGGLEALVNAAGTNTRKRGLAEVSYADFRSIIDVNLLGSYHCVRAVLPEMRKQGGGTIVNIVSDAGLRANRKSGIAYIASKFGQAGLTQTINEEEREHGIRACSIFPGDIDTPLLKLRPVMPTPEARGRMLQADDVAACAVLALTLPKRAVIEHLVVRPLA